MKHITIGTRASKLAMIQTYQVVERLRQQWPNLAITIEQISTRGDRVGDLPLTQIGGDGVFVTEIERALHERRIDLAVHSLKDLPTAQPTGLHIVVIGPREDVRDVLVWNAWHPQGGQGDVGQGDRPAPGRPQGYAPTISEHERQLETAPPQGDCKGTPLLYPNTSANRSIVGVGLAPTLVPGYPAPLRIGTCSLRRTAQIRALYPDAQILPLRGNVDTRLRKLEAGDYDAIVLAAAGLHRLEMQGRLTDRITYLPVEVMMPAPGQGALALEIRDEPEMHALVAPIGDAAIQATTSAERMFMRRLGAGCYLPVAAYGEVIDATLTLRGLVISLDGQSQVRVCQSIRWTSETPVEHAEQLGVMLAEQALTQGADEIIAPTRDATTSRAGNQNVVAPLVGARLAGARSGYPLQGKRILVTRTREQASALSERLRALGATPMEFPTIQIVPPEDWEPLDNALRRLCTANSAGLDDLKNSPYAWLVFTSANGVNMSFERLRNLGYEMPVGKVRVAAIGPATAATLTRYGISADLVPTEYMAESVASAIIEDARQRGESLEGQRVLLARAAEARKVLVTALQQAGAVVDEVAAYRTISVASDDEQGREVLRLLQAHQIDFLTFTSSSTVRNFVQWLRDCELPVAEPSEYIVTHNPQLKIACIGPITSQTARELGLDVHIEAKEFTIDGLVEAIVQHEEKNDRTDSSDTA